KLLQLISQAPKNSYLLREMIDFMERISTQKVLDGNYNQTAFERWLNQHSGLSYEENREIRGKIVGKYIPRDEFQTYFPIGHGKVYNNSHVVTAHNPPDLDSTTASFLGWLDAFACRVSSSLTIWNMPLGQPGPVIAKLFTDIYSNAIFTRVAKAKAIISPVAMDLVRQNRMIRVAGESNIRDFQHNRHENHIILVDRNGFYIGDWRVADVDSVGRIQRLLNICLNIFENQLIKRTTEILSREVIAKGDLENLINRLLDEKIPENCVKNHRFNSDDYDQLDSYLKKVLHIDSGCESSMLSLFETLDNLADTNFLPVIKKIREFLNEDNYDENDLLHIPASKLFKIFNEAYSLLTESGYRSRKYTDRIDVAISIKQNVLGNLPSYLNTKAEFNEVVEKIKDYPHITVCFPDKKARLVPVGVIHREDLEEPSQGTVSLRDFCNFDEIKLASNVQVISAIDHHKSTLNSPSCMTLTVADVQSANVLTAEKAFELNDAYGMRGQTAASVEQQLAELHNLPSTAKTLRLQEKLLKKKLAHHRAGSHFFINPERELQEYFFCLNAIIDDTDLLSKCGWRDITCVTELINRIKSIICEKEVEIIDVTHYPRDSKALKQAIRDVLVNADAYSFYKGIYVHRQDIVDEWISDSSLHHRCFEDRKIQNETCAVSQFKIFPGNKETLNKHRLELQLYWFRVKKLVRSKASEVDFFLHMNSTIPGGQEAYEGKLNDSQNHDEIWINVNTESDLSTSRFRQFLDYIKTSPKYSQIALQISLEGPECSGRRLIASILRASLLNMSFEIVDKDTIPEPIVVFRFKEGSLNSRKADITPFLPNH
ncbi:MAG: hypothetical protein HRT88_12650, partial [Lentisphaeraceae bacterium]|nr:hypothetical protein [Lentisphaeraceae bacterium]